MSLTILHINTARGWRGGERQTLWLAEALQRAGHRNLILARPGERLATDSAASGLEVIALAPHGEMDPLAAWTVRGIIQRRSVRVVHAHTGHAVALAALGTLSTGARVVVARRVAWPLRANLLSSWKYRRAHAVIAVSEAAAAALVASGVPSERIEVVPDGVDLRRMTEPATPDTLHVLGVASGAPLVVMVGALDESKDPLTFVRAVSHARARVPTLQALLVGEGPLRSAVNAEIARLGLGSVLHLTGFRRDADALLAAADVCVLSSQEEGLGTVLLDAMALGVPVAATAAGGIPELVESDRSGLLAPVHDAAALGDAIARLLTDRALAHRMVTGGLARVTNFSIERTAERTLAVYERLLRGAE